MRGRKEKESKKDIFHLLQSEIGMGGNLKRAHLLNYVVVSKAPII